jgi:hypothetical protein
MAVYVEGVEEAVRRYFVELLCSLGMPCKSSTSPRRAVRDLIRLHIRRWISTSTGPKFEVKR